MQPDQIDFLESKINYYVSMENPVSNAATCDDL